MPYTALRKHLCTPLDSDFVHKFGEAKRYLHPVCMHADVRLAACVMTCFGAPAADAPGRPKCMPSCVARCCVAHAGAEHGGTSAGMTGATWRLQQTTRAARLPWRTPSPSATSAPRWARASTGAPPCTTCDVFASLLALWSACCSRRAAATSHVHMGCSSREAPAAQHYPARQFGC